MFVITTEISNRLRKRNELKEKIMKETHIDNNIGNLKKNMEEVQLKIKQHNELFTLNDKRIMSMEIGQKEILNKIDETNENIKEFRQLMEPFLKEFNNLVGAHNTIIANNLHKF